MLFWWWMNKLATCIEEMMLLVISYLLSLRVYTKEQLCTTNLCILFFWSNPRLYIAMVAETFGYMGRGLLVACHRSLPYQGKTTVILISMAVSRPITELQLRSTQRWAVFAMSWARRWKMQRLYIRICSPSSMILLPTTLNMVSKQNTLVSKHIVYKPHRIRPSRRGFPLLTR